METPTISVTDQLEKLDTARKLVLGDAAYYPQIVQVILPIIGAGARLELRRWGADFLAETFASPTLATQQKQGLCLTVLETVKDMFEGPEEDPQVLKSLVQTAASIYPLVFRHIITNAADSQSWERMAAIKTRVLRMWDNAATGVRVCCIKLVQRVIQVQTPGVIADPRRPEQNEISLALVPRDHSLIPPPNLEAEASGLLDRLLNVFHEEASDAVLVTATLNCLGVLIRSRPSIANKIVSTILNFNPLKQAKAPMTPEKKVLVKAMERTTRALLLNVNKTNPTSPLAPRIQQYVDNLVRSRMDIFEEGSRKRAAPSEPTDGLDPSKRARLGAEAPISTTVPLRIPPLPPGPTSIAQLFTVTDDVAFTSFDVQQLPLDMVIQITLPLLYRVDQGHFDAAINVSRILSWSDGANEEQGVRTRYQTLSQQQPAVKMDGAMDATTHAEDEDDDYEPDYQPAEDDEQILNKLETAPPEPEPVHALAPFEMPPPPPLTDLEAQQIGQETITRMFGVMYALDDVPSSRQARMGINRLAASNYDRDAWVTIISRLATRASASLDHVVDDIKEEDMGKSLTLARPTLNDTVREFLYMHIIEDFRNRINAAISWLNEEWYDDRLRERSGSHAPSQYEKWALKLLDGIMPYLDAKDKVFTRFLSEIPAIDEKVLERVKGLARDPERVNLAVTSLHYLVLLRPPVRELCIDALEDLWRNYEDAKSAAAKVLMRWRPQALEFEQKPNGLKLESGNETPLPSEPVQSSTAIAT
ncbi:MAG: hypothetical protein M1817_002447 [Caeruleum heppii]|nr:MAG: hypothetical protein M1817_002447 [Caeruleum heppii]